MSATILNHHDAVVQPKADFDRPYAYVAMYEFQKTKELLIFGGDTKGGHGESETIFAVDATVPLTSGEREMAQQAMKTLNILDNVSERVTRTSHFRRGCRTK